MRAPWTHLALSLAACAAPWLASPALALDAACERVASASEKKLAAPAFHDRKDLGSLVHEMLLADGKLYQRNTLAGKPADPWAPSPVTLAQVKAAAGTYRRQLQACRSLGPEAVDGVAAEVIVFKVKTGDALVEGKVWIGSADGLPYREESTGMKGRTVYRGVVAPR